MKHFLECIVIFLIVLIMLMVVAGKEVEDAKGKLDNNSIGEVKEKGWEDYTNEEIAEAIFASEGGDRATYLYGIQSISYRDKADARRLCCNSVRNAKKRWKNAGKPLDFVTHMGMRYCPLNYKVWTKNVKWFLKNK